MPQPKRYKATDPSLEDEKQAELTKAATDALLEALRPVFKANPNILLNQLSRSQLERAVIAALSAYQVRRSELEELNDPLDDLYAPLPTPKGALD